MSAAISLAQACGVGKSWRPLRTRVGQRIALRRGRRSGSADSSSSSSASVAREPPAAAATIRETTPGCSAGPWSREPEGLDQLDDIDAAEHLLAKLSELLPCGLIEPGQRAHQSQARDGHPAVERETQGVVGAEREPDDVHRVRGALLHHPFQQPMDRGERVWQEPWGAAVPRQVRDDHTPACREPFGQRVEQGTIERLSVQEKYGRRACGSDLASEHELDAPSCHR